ncbi:hypothetical protein ACTG16_23280 [Aeromonas sp. 23P]|uniref:hypothetical protein n=1 Tax=Aeromonas sp. 23P TaxID=3452716 RepID=UPI003F78DB3C
MTKTVTPAIHYYVVNENTLAYQHDGVATFNVMGSNKDGHNWMDGPFHVGSTDKIRPATEQDFDTFSVNLHGHKKHLRLQQKKLAEQAVAQ